MTAARAAYEQQGAADKLQLYVVPGCVHECTACMWDKVRAGGRGFRWMHEWCRKGAGWQVVRRMCCVLLSTVVGRWVDMEVIPMHASPCPMRASLCVQVHAFMDRHLLGTA